MIGNAVGCASELNCLTESSTKALASAESEPDSRDISGVSDGNQMGTLLGICVTWADMAMVFI